MSRSHSVDLGFSSDEDGAGSDLSFEGLDVDLPDDTAPAKPAVIAARAAPPRLVPPPAAASASSAAAAPAGVPKSLQSPAAQFAASLAGAAAAAARTRHSRQNSRQSSANNSPVLAPTPAPATIPPSLPAAAAAVATKPAASSKPVAPPAAASAALAAAAAPTATKAAAAAKKKQRASHDSDSDDGSVGSLDFSSDSSLGMSEEDEKSPKAAKKQLATGAKSATAATKPAAVSIPAAAAPAPTAAVSSPPPPPASSTPVATSVTRPPPPPSSAAPAAANEKKNKGTDDFGLDEFDDDDDEDLDLGHDDLNFDLDDPAPAASKPKAAVAEPAPAKRSSAVPPPPAVPVSPDTGSEGPTPRAPEYPQQVAPAEPSSLASTATYEIDPSFATAASSGQTDAAQESSQNSSTPARMSTAETIAAARERQARKDDYASNVLSGREESSSAATLYNPSASRSGPTGTSSVRTPSRSPGRSRTTPAKPDFVVTSKATPLSRKLQQAQKDAQQYNAQTRTPFVANKIGRGRSGKKKASAAAGTAARSSGDDEAKDASGGDGSQADLPPVEHEADSPWLDAVAQNMGDQGSAGGIAAQSAGRNLGTKRFRAKRTSVIYRENEPLVGLAAAPPDVDELATHMQQLFALQRPDGAAAGGSSAPSSAKKQQQQRVDNTISPGRMVTVFGQRVPADAFPRTFSASKKAALAAREQSMSARPALSASGSVRSAAERAQIALATALASIKPSMPPSSSDPNAPDDGGDASSSPEQKEQISSALVALAPESDALSVGEIETESDALAAQEFSRAFEALSPDSYYRQQLQGEERLGSLARENAFNFEQQLHAASEADARSMADRSERAGEEDSDRSAQRGGGDQTRSALPPKQSGRVRDPFGVYRNTPAGTGNMYLAQLAKAAAKKTAQWQEVSAVSSAWGAALGGAGGSSNGGRGRAATQREAESAGQYATKVHPGRYSMERKRAKQHAAQVAQIHAQHALAQASRGSIGSHPALQHHMTLLDSHPEAAHFLAGHSADAPYDDEHVQVALAPFDDGHESYGEGSFPDDDSMQQYDDPEHDPRYPLGMHSHAERMARSRAARGEGSSGEIRGPQHHAHKKHVQSRSQLKAELMGTLHAGLFGAEDQAFEQQQQQQHDQQQQQSEPQLYDDAASESGVGAGGGAEGRLPFISPHRLAEQASVPASASAFHFKNVGTGAREFVAEGESEEAAAARTHQQEVEAARRGSVNSQSTTTTDGAHLQNLPSYYAAPAPYAAHGSPFIPPRDHGDDGGVEIPQGLLESVTAHHFAGRDLRASVHSSSGARGRKGGTTQTSRSASKRRNDQLMERLFNPELARQQDMEREAAREAQIKAEKAARRQARRPVATNEAHQQHYEHEDTQSAAQRLRDAIDGGADDSTLAALSEEHSLQQTPREDYPEQSAANQSLLALAGSDDMLGSSGDDATGVDAEVAAHARGGSSVSGTEVADAASGGDSILSPRTAAARPKENFDRARSEAKVREGIARAASIGARKRDEFVSMLKRSAALPPPKRDSASPPRTAAEQVSRLDVLYYKARLAEQKLTSQRAAQAAAELAACTFSPNLDVVVLKGKVLSKAAMAANRARRARRREGGGGAAGRSGGEGSASEDESSIHSSMASSGAPSSTTVSGAGGGAAPSQGSAAAATKARLDALYSAHLATQEKLRAKREAAALAQAQAEAALPFAPNVHPHRPVAATVAMAHTQYIKGFDEKVERMRRGAQQAQAQSFATSLRSSGASSVAGGAGANSGGTSHASMNFSLEPAPAAAQHAHYIAAHRSVVLEAQVPLSSPGPGTALSSLPFAAITRDSPRAPSAAAQSFRPDAHTPVPQIIMPGAPGSSAPFQMLSGANPGSPRSLNFAPSTNKASYIQEGKALDSSLPLPSDVTVGVGSMEGAESLRAPVPLAAQAGAAYAGMDLGLGIVLPNNSPGSMLPRALAVHEHVSSYAYQFNKAQVLAAGGAGAASTAPVPPAAGLAALGGGTSKSPRFASTPSSGMSSRSGVATPTSSKLRTPTASSATAGRKGSPSPTRHLPALDVGGTPRASSGEEIIVMSQVGASPVAPAASSAPSAVAARAPSPASAIPSSPPTLLFVDIALPSGTERIVVKAGDDTGDLAAAFTRQHQLDPAYSPVIQQMLDAQVQALPS